MCSHVRKSNTSNIKKDPLVCTTKNFRKVRRLLFFFFVVMVTRGDKL